MHVFVDFNYFLSCNPEKFSCDSLVVKYKHIIRNFIAFQTLLVASPAAIAPVMHNRSKSATPARGGTSGGFMVGMCRCRWLVLMVGVGLMMIVILVIP